MLNKAIGFFRLRLISRRWAPATRVSQGTKEEFSTGSHAQKPPKLNASYAKHRPSKYPYRVCQCRRWTMPASSTNGPSDRPVLPMHMRTEWMSRQTQEEGRRMDGHPVILQQRVEALPVGTWRRGCCPGCPRKSTRSAHPQDRNGSSPSWNEIDPEQHGCQEVRWQQRLPVQRCAILNPTAEAPPSTLCQNIHRNPPSDRPNALKMAMASR